MFVGAYLVLRPAVWGWYFVPLHFVKFLLAAFGLTALVNRVQFARRTSMKRWAVAGGGLVLFSGIVIGAKVGPAPIRRHVYEPLQAWLRQYPANGKKMMAGDIGAVGYYSGAYIYDLAGLVTNRPQVARDVASAVETWQPDYLFLVVSRSQVGALLANPDEAARYWPVARFSRTGQQNLVPRFDELHPRWQQDYILYERTRGTERTSDARPTCP